MQRLHTSELSGPHGTIRKLHDRRPFARVTVKLHAPVGNIPREYVFQIFKGQLREFRLKYLRLDYFVMLCSI